MDRFRNLVSGNWARVVGISDEITTCEACGKANLKRTVAIEVNEGEAVVYMGTDCASRATGRKASRLEQAARAVATEIIKDGPYAGLTARDRAALIEIERERLMAAVGPE